MNVFFKDSEWIRNVLCRNIWMIKNALIQIRNFNFHFTTSKMKNYSDKLLIGYTRDQMFNIVSDVEQYETFIPFCSKSEVISRDLNRILANISIGFKPIREKYLSDVELSAPNYIHAVGSNGKIFDHLETLWKFSNGPINVKNSCITEFSISFHFKSLLYSALADPIFNQMVHQTERAFLTEAFKRYGKPSTKTIKLYTQ